VLGLPVVLCAADAPQQKPNVVFILADDLGWSDVSCYGQKLWETPHIDRLAQEGMLFYTEQHVDGVSIASLCRGAAAVNRDTLFWHHPHYSTTAVPCSAVRQGDWKLVKFYSDYQRVWQADGKGRGKVVETRDPALLQLYNLEQNIGEKENLGAKMPKKATDLHNLLLEHLRQTKARLPVRNPQHDPSKPETGTYKM